ncbi:hypothetical protein BN1723_013034 [Verticillium longisporum]|uniref:Uncharacterized protein n=1 Tax=Verticillium longisporum TaxID=100787 RepID=A0A0G4LNS0_VERLO|nr:hypothetical protein BN1708_012985 [Verticillium longisporum]CRK23584.1 hypothetical protein BN1723_013034 [Verticillium longisporum]
MALSEPRAHCASSITWTARSRETARLRASSAAKPLLARAASLLRRVESLHPLLDVSRREEPPQPAGRVPRKLQSRTIRAALDIGRRKGFCGGDVGEDAGPDFGQTISVMADGSAMLRLATRLSCVFRTLGNSITDLLRLVSTGQENGTAGRSAPTGARASSIVTVDFCTALLAASWTAEILGHNAMIAIHYWSIGESFSTTSAMACTVARTRLAMRRVSGGRCSV